jgi:hypothetical protein
VGSVTFTYKPVSVPDPEPVSKGVVISDLVTDNVNKINTHLTVRVYDSEGNLKDSRYKPDDLILNNFKNILIRWLWANTTDIDSYAYPHDLTNVERTLMVRMDSSDTLASFRDSISDTEHKGAHIGIGTGTTSPIGSNYCLESQHGSWTAISQAPLWNSTQGNVTITSSIACTSSVSISEAVLMVQWVDTGSTVRQFALCRDTFTPISVINGDSVAVAYSICLDDTGFTDNFGKALSMMLDYATDGTDGLLGSSLDLYDHLGSPRDLRSFGFSSIDNTIANFPGGSLQQEVWIGNSTVTPARNQYTLSHPIESPVGLTYVQTLSGDLVIQADAYCQNSNTVTEAGFFMRLTDDNYNFMMIRDTFSGVSVDAGHFINIRFELDM